MIKKTLLMSWLFILTSFSVSAAINDYIVKQWNVQNGLPSQSIKSLVQDKQGYVWLGTQFGLSRFDGYQFRNFTTQNTQFLQTNAIHKLLLDRHGKLWIGTKRGLHRLNPLTLEVRSFNIKGPILDIVEDKQGDIWVAGNGLFYIGNDNQAQRDFDLALSSDKLAVNRISQIVGNVSKIAQGNDGLWLVNERNLLKINKSSTNRRDVFRLELGFRLALPEQLAQTIIHDLAWIEGRLYLASELGAYFLDIDQVLRRYTELGNGAVYKFMHDPDTGLWVSTSTRLMFREGVSDWRYVEPVHAEQAIWFSDMFKDGEGNIWFASLNEGLWFAHTGNIARHMIDGNSQQGITATTMDNQGRTWIASRSGVGYLNKDDVLEVVISTEDLKNSTVYELEFSGNSLFIGTERGALIYEQDVLQLLPFRELRQTPVLAITPSQRGGIWIGTGSGMYRLEYSGLTPFAYNAFLGSQFITYINDQPNVGFIGTNKGAYQFNQKGIEKLGGQTSLESAYVTSILYIQGVATLVGSWNDGLFYRTAKGDWYQLDASNGLPHGSISSLYYDKQQALIWVSTRKGVYRLPAAQFTHPINNLKVEQVISQFDRQLDGKVGRCCSGFGGDAVLEKQGAIWYPSSQGAVEIPKNVELFGSKELSPKLEEVITQDRAIVASEFADLLKLDTSERDITINYTAIDFYAPTSIEFRYRLTGKENTEWREVFNRREAIYTNLEPGVYNFELQVKRKGEGWQQARSVTQRIEIPRRFDETVYFRLLITLGFVLLFYVFFWIFRAQERRKQQALETLVEERTMALRQANDKLNQVNTQMKLVSHTDELTGLKSRRFLFDQLPKDVEHYQRNSQSLQQQDKRLVLLIINVDNFSKVNDAYGPIGGDSCLQQLATLLNTRTQGSDYVARWSGDEFLLLLRDFKRDAIEIYIKELCRAIAECDFQLPNGKSINMTVSMGWSFYPLPLLGGQVISWEASVNLADVALHQVKQRGGDGAATITFDDQLDAFEFEQSSHVESQLQTLQANGLADVKIWMR